MGLKCLGTESSWTELGLGPEVFGTEKYWTVSSGTETSWTESSLTELS